MLSRTVQTDASEKRLIEAAAAGDADALAALVARHGTAVFATAARLLGNGDEADDVVQEVFIGLPEALARYAHEGRFEAWLKRLAARVALMHMRRTQHRRSLLELFQPARPHQAPDDVAHRLDIDRALGTLPEDLRTVFVLKVVAGYSHDEIARLLHIRRGTSQVRLYRAIRRLRSALEDSA